MDNNKLNENLVFDLDAIKQFIFEEDENYATTHDNEITETYGLNDDGKQELLSKVVHEVKGSDFSDKETIRYDLFKSFLEVLGNVEIDNEMTPMTLLERMVLNTLSGYGMIKDASEFNNENTDK